MIKIPGALTQKVSGSYIYIYIFVYLYGFRVSGIPKTIFYLLKGDYRGLGPGVGLGVSGLVAEGFRFQT